MRGRAFELSPSENIVRSLRVIGLLILVVAVVFLIRAKRLQTTESEFLIDGIRVLLPDDIGPMPAEWKREIPPPRVVGIPESDKEAARNLISDALSRYPKGFLKKHVTKVIVYEWLIFQGDLYAGGTYYEPSTVFITFRNDAEQFWIEHNFHAEVSSLLYHKFPEKVMAAGVIYEISEAADVRGDGLLDRDEELLERGYFYQYATLSPEEDFNAICGTLFAGFPFTWQDAAPYKRLTSKMKRTVDFFTSIDSRFSVEYFKQVGEGGRR